MKPIVLTKEAEDKLRTYFIEKFNKELENYKFNVNDTKLSFSFDSNIETKEKITILYTQKAYLRMMALVDFYDTEVGWYGLVQKINDKLYYVYDVKVCKQYVTGTKVDTEDEDVLEFFNSLTDDEIEHMHFQAHSHVKMSTGASGTDLQNQTDVIRNMGKSGFYIFQIWNKNMDINTYLYDLDNNLFYNNKDILIEIEDEDDTISGFISDTMELVEERKFNTYNYNSQYNKAPKKEEITKEEREFLSDYYGGAYERWDF